MKNKGFSLIEAMIVLAIVAILMALTIPSLSTLLTQSQAKSKADAIASGLQLARSEAFKRNTSITVQFVAGVNNNYTTGAYSFGCTQTIYVASADYAPCPIKIKFSEAVSGSLNIAVSPGPATGVIASVTFDPFGNLSSTNLDGSYSVNLIAITPIASGSFGFCPLKNGYSACEVDVKILPSGSVRTCYPSMSAPSELACV